MAWQDDQVVPSPEAPSPMVRLGRGMMDVYQGAKQKYFNWTDDELAEAYTDKVNKEIDYYERGRGEDAGFDWTRLAGNIATPLMAIPGGSQTTAVQAGLGGLAGALAGYSLFNPENDPVSNTINTGVGTVAGALTNVAGPHVVKGVVYGAQKGTNAIRNALRGTVDDSTVMQALRNAGIQINNAPAAIRQRIMGEAREQLTSGDLNPQQLIRKVEIEEIAGPGSSTRAQVTRDPADWTNARNTQKVEANVPSVQRGETDTLTSRYMQQDDSMKGYVTGIADDIAPDRPPTTYKATEGVINEVKKIDDDAAAAVDDLYKIYRETGKQGTQIPDIKIADELGRLADEVGVENIPSPVLNRLKEFGFLDGERLKLLTIQEADKLNRLINNNNPGFGPESLALGRLKTALNQSLLDVPEEGATQALIAARKAAADRFAAQESGKGITRILNDVAPDKFIQQNIINGDVRDIIALRDYLLKSGAGEKAWNNMRAFIPDEIREMATAKGRGPFSGASFQNYLKKLGPEKLEILFPDHLPKIRTLENASINMTYAPPFNAVNNSNTTPALMGQVLRGGNSVPGLNLITDPIERSMQNRQAEGALARALSGNVSNRAETQAATSEMIAKELMRHAPPMVAPSLMLEQSK